MKDKIAVGLSGGVDSSVAALLLKEKFNVEGIFMKNWEEDDHAEYCSAKKDLDDVQKVCEKICIPFKKTNFSLEYWEKVFKDFLKGYKNGYTPNPDILCNKEIKFKVFLEYALLNDKKYMATGHYARKKVKGGIFQLLKAADKKKDQSYFLHTLTQKELKHALFPIGSLTKEKVRKIAKENQLITHNKKDSTGICFIGKRKFKIFLEKYLKKNSGEIRDENGNKLGEHDGLMFYTIGQRKGIELGGLKGKTNLPWFVVEKNIKKNVLIVAQGKKNPLLLKNNLVTETLNWIAGKPPSEKFECKAKIRYQQKEKLCSVHIKKDGRAEVYFQEPQRAITPGQSVVFYDNEICLGGGIIKN